METTWREELAWAAGFFDGEGCFRLHTKGGTEGRYYAQTTINQIHPEVLERFQKAVLGLGKIHGPDQPCGTKMDGSPKSPLWNYRCTNFEGTQAIYAMLSPFLGSVKREQGRKVLSQCQRPRIISDTKCIHGHDKTPANTTKWGQCRECARGVDRRRRPARCKV